MLRDSASTLVRCGVKKYNIEAEHEQSGWVQPVHSPGRIKYRGAPREAVVEIWGAGRIAVEATQVGEMTGSDAWYRRLLEQHRRSRQSAGAGARTGARRARPWRARIYARSPAISFERRNDKWIVKTAKGEISGRALDHVATNAYSGEFSKSLVPDIATEVMPVLSWQMSTQPLSDNVRKTIIPGRQAVSDTHGELYFARYDARNRLITGGAVLGPGNKVERIKARVTERLQRSVAADWRCHVRPCLERLCRHDRGFPAAYPSSSGLTPMAGPAATAAPSRLRSRSGANWRKPCKACPTTNWRCRSPSR